MGEIQTSYLERRENEKDKKVKILKDVKKRKNNDQNDGYESEKEVAECVRIVSDEGDNDDIGPMICLAFQCMDRGEDRVENENENDESAEDMQQELHVLLRVVQKVNLNLMCIKSDEGDDNGVDTGSIVCPAVRSMDRG